MSSVSSLGTHLIEFGAASVVKRFRVWDRHQHDHEWRALRLLAEHAPGLAPTPIRRGWCDGAPLIEMSRLEGVPPRGRRLADAEVSALVEATTRLHTAVPQPRLARLPPRSWYQDAVIDQAWAWHEAPPAPATTARIAPAVRAGMRWLALSPPTLPAPEGVAVVFGPGDGNLANYLWDGHRVRVVDFEDSGRSDRCFELAEVSEHVSAWVDTDFDAEDYLARFELSAAERARLRECRRLLALVWLFLLCHDDPDSPRNPVGSARRQADRLLALLG